MPDRSALPKAGAVTPARPGRDDRAARAALRLVWRRGRLLVFLLVLAVTCLRIWDPWPVATARSGLFDLYQRVSPKPAPAVPIAIVNIDESSLAQHGQWPWPRGLLAQLVEAAAQHGALVVGFNILFPESDRMTPDNVLRSMPEVSGEVAAAILRQPSGDEALAASFAKVPVVLGLAVDGRIGRPALWSTATPAGASAPFEAGRDFGAFLFGYQRMLANLPLLAAASAGAGAVAVLPGESGVIREAPVAVEISGAIVPSLASEMVRLGSGGAKLRLEVSSLGIEGLRTPAGLVPTDRNGDLWIAYAYPDRSRYVSAADLLTGALPAGALDGKYVLIGTTASGIADFNATPLGLRVPGLEIQAQILASLLSGNVLIRPVTVDLIEIGFPLVMAIAGLTMARRRRLRRFAYLCGVSALAWFPASALAYARADLLIDPVYPAVTALIIGALLVATEIIVARRAAEQTVQEREARLRELQVELQSLSRLAAIEQMSSALAHELNQPLAAISNFVQASRRLLSNMPAESGAPGQIDKVGGYLEKAIGQVDRAAAIVVGLRNLVQRGETERAPEDVNDTVAEAVETAFIGIPAGAVTIRYRLAQRLPPVAMNRIQIQQVILNLVRNATEAMRDQAKGTLTIGTGLADGRVEVTVADDGPGIAPDFEEKLFQPFATTKEKGMGIGLSISRSIIEAHGGELTAARNGDRGMTFRFTLPLPETAS